MRLVQIGVKVDVTVKARLLELIESGKYRDMTDLITKAIREKLDRESKGISCDQDLLEMIDRAKHIDEEYSRIKLHLEEIEEKLKSLET